MPSFLFLTLAFGSLWLPRPPLAPPALATSLLLVANKGEHTLGLIDPEAGRQLAAIPVGGITGHEVAASPDGQRAFVPIYGNSGVGLPGSNGRTLSVIDLGGRRIVGTVDFGRGVRPHCALFGPENHLLYVTTELANSVTVIDPKRLKIVETIPTGQAESHMLAISPDGRRGYTANVGPGTVSVLDLSEPKTLAVIPVARTVQRISISTDGRWVFTSDQSQPRLAVIDTADNQVSRWVTLESTGYGTAPTPDGRWLLVAMPGANKVAVVDLGTMEVARTLSVPPTPREILIRPDGEVAYVSCDRSSEVAAIQVSHWKVDKLIHAGRGADGLAWAGR